MRKTVFALAALASLQGCGPGIYQQQLADIKRRQAIQAVETEATIADIQASPLPPDYQKRVKAYMTPMFRDPSPPIFAFGRTPLGSLACFTVNAKNAYGGYTGPEPYLLSFDKSGEVKNFQIVSVNLLYGSYISSPDRSDISYRLAATCFL